MASLEPELTCPVCRDVFSQSHPLPCGHSFCPACVREAWSDPAEGRGRFVCPQCEEERGGVPCDCCPSDAEEPEAALAVKTCLRCEVSLCGRHLRPHLERPAFSSHLLVEPLGELAHRRCPEHAEMLRYYCADDRLYVCGDCLLGGGHAQHKVKALRQVEEELKVSRGNEEETNGFSYLVVWVAHLCWTLQVILQTLLSKADEKLRDAEKILEEFQNIDSTTAVSLRPSCFRSI